MAIDSGKLNREAQEYREDCDRLLEEVKRASKKRDMQETRTKASAYANRQLSRYVVSLENHGLDVDHETAGNNMLNALELAGCDSDEFTRRFSASPSTDQEAATNIEIMYKAARTIRESVNGSKLGEDLGTLHSENRNKLQKLRKDAKTLRNKLRINRSEQEPKEKGGGGFLEKLLP